MRDLWYNIFSLTENLINALKNVFTFCFKTVSQLVADLNLQWVSDLLEDTFIGNLTVFSLMIGTALTVYLTYSIVKFFIPT